MCATQFTSSEGHVLAVTVLVAPFEKLLESQRVTLSEQSPSQDQLFMVHMNGKDLDPSPRWGCSARAFELWAVLEVA